MSSQHTVIVGGSSGIGLATARQLLASGAEVTLDTARGAVAAAGSAGGGNGG